MVTMSQRLDETERFIPQIRLRAILVGLVFATKAALFPLGFWFAQQGSIYVFVALIFYYAWRMNRLDREFDVHED